MNDFAENRKKRPLIDLGRLLNDSPNSQSNVCARDGGEHRNKNIRNRKDRVIMDWEPRRNHEQPLREEAFVNHDETALERKSTKVISMAAMNVAQRTASKKHTDGYREPYTLNPASVNKVEPSIISEHDTTHYHHPDNMTRQAGESHSTATESANVARNVTPGSNGRKKGTAKTSAKPTNASTRIVQGGPLLSPPSAAKHPVPVPNGMSIYPPHFGNSFDYNGPPVPPSMVGNAPCHPTSFYPHAYPWQYPPTPLTQPPCQCEMCCAGGKMTGSRRPPFNSFAKSGNNAKKGKKGTRRKASSSKGARNAKAPRTKAAGHTKRDGTDGDSAAALLRGVTLRASGKWQAQLYWDGKSTYIGVFPTREKAARAYEIARGVLKPVSTDTSTRDKEALLFLARKAAYEGVNEKFKALVRTKETLKLSPSK